MIVTVQNTKNNTLIINYKPEKQRQELLNEVWREREDYLNNNFNKISDIIFFDLNTNNDNSFLGDYDIETRRIQEKNCYATYIRFSSLINELKALTPLYKDYTIINFKCSGMSYDFEKNERCNMCPTTDIEQLDTHDELIAEPFGELIRFLKGYEICRDYYIYDFSVELLPNKTKSKRKRTNVPRGMRHEVFKRDNYACVECGASKSDGATLHIDHIIPVNKGGTDELDNLQTLCSDCNLNKSDVIQSNGK